MSEISSNSAAHITPALTAKSDAENSGALKCLLSGWGLALISLAICWISLFKELSGEWNINPEYGYGYAVPLIGPVLIWRRWRKRPAPSAAISLLPGIIAAVLLLCLLPVHLVLEANPEWRLLYWWHGFLVLGLSFCFLYRAGGWSWVKFFAPPLAFMLIAIPWPMQWEQSAVQGLMRFIAGLTVAVVGLLGIPALQHGNLIEVGSGVVGINEACSGVRSLQSALMLSLFLGEMYLFRLQRRLLLLAASLLTVLLANLVRTSFLTWMAAEHGLQQMQAVHDSAGFLVMVIVLPSLFGLAYVMNLNHKEPFKDSTDRATLSKIMPRWVATSVVVWLGFSWTATEAWYRSHETNLTPSPRWSIAWPRQAPHFNVTAVPEESLAILRCSHSESAEWEDSDENQWSAFFLRWSAGKNSAQLAFGHRPDICFPASGAQLIDNYGYMTVHANGLDLPFRYLTFQEGQRLVHVFYCLWSDQTSPDEESLPEDGSWKSRLQAVLAGRRNLGQQVLEVVVAGPEDSPSAITLFKQELPQLILRQNGGGTSLLTSH